MIKTKTVIYCDKCGKEMDSKTDYIKCEAVLFRENALKFINENPNIDRFDKDICFECWGELFPDILADKDAENEHL